MDSKKHKRVRFSNDENYLDEPGSVRYDHVNKHADDRARCHNLPNNYDVLALPKILEELSREKYGSATKEYENVRLHCTQFINYLCSVRSSLTRQRSPVSYMRAGPGACDKLLKTGETTYFQTNAGDVHHGVNKAAIIVPISENGKDTCQITKEEASKPVIVIDSDEEDQQCHRKCTVFRNTRVDASFSVHLNDQPSVQYHQVILTEASNRCSEEIQGKIFTENGEGSIRLLNVEVPDEDQTNVGIHSSSDYMSQDFLLSSGPYPEDDFGTPKTDGLEDLWNEMSLALEYSKSSAVDNPVVSAVMENDSEDCDHDYLLKVEELICQICGDIKKSCDHDYLLRDDIGLVCRICGFIKKSIATIFDYQWRKASHASRTYTFGSRKTNILDENIACMGFRLFEEDMISGELSVHPRHLKQMKPHQVEGFNFLVRNLVGDKPGGCILAHAPGSGKTFMLISFIQGFLAKYPSARPLIILPKGILPTWKREFQRWQVEEIPLLDFYSVKADNRVQQLGVLKKWEENRSILFLGYKQFSNIVCGAKDKITAACQETLIKVPSLLILDEGHTPRNENTNILSTLEKVVTPRKVVLSGTLFQNHVREVFNILNLVRRKFLKMESSKDAVRRILSRTSISRRYLKSDMEGTFCDIVEETLKNDEHPKRRALVIQDLREMMQGVLHYYRGDFLDELPGNVDFTILLNLTSKQKKLIEDLGTYDKFKGSAVGSAVYLHPCLKDCANYAPGEKSAKLKEQEIDNILESIDLNDGVKTKFVMSILSMADTAGEKVLVFSQYILPLRFLERLIFKVKGWRSGRETFMISGDTTPELREKSMAQFNQSSDARVLFGSIKACGEGISLTGASRVIILDVHLNPSVSRQAIGRAFRPGQTKKVYTYRLVAADSPEERDHHTCFRKELISKMWFEWSEHSGCQDFELESIDIEDSQDLFLNHLPSVEDIKSLHRR